MNILWHIRYYVPNQNTGAEHYAHELNKFLISQGHKVRVMLGEDGAKYDIDGVEVFPKPSNWYDPISEADLIFSHLDFTAAICQLAPRRPIVWFVHNENYYSTVARHKDHVFVVYNSYAIQNIITYPNPSTTLQPPVDIDYYAVERGDCITLINLNEAKGAETFYDLAEAFPDKRFLGVKGAYGLQIIKDLPNVEILETQTDIREVYKRTSILLMPSKKETWGRTATEAAASGIPVVCSPIYGLVENLGEAGIYCENLDEYKAAIKKLGTKKEYNAASKRVRSRAEELRADDRLHKFDEYIHKVAARPYKKKDYGSDRS